MVEAPASWLLAYRRLQRSRFQRVIWRIWDRGAPGLFRLSFSIGLSIRCVSFFIRMSDLRLRLLLLQGL